MKSNSKNGYHFIVGMDETLRDRLNKYAHQREVTMAEAVRRMIDEQTEPLPKSRRVVRRRVTKGQG